MNTLDRAILAIAPGWALRRLEARLKARAYDAAMSDRETSRKPSRLKKRSPRQEALEGRDSLLNVARDLDANNSHAHGVFWSLAHNVIGSGILPDPRLIFPNGDPDRVRNGLAREVFLEWAEGCDREGRQSFFELQLLAEREAWIAGECFVVRSAAEGRRVPIALEFVPTERIAQVDKDLEGGGRIIQGVEYSAFGKIAAYYIHPENPLDLSYRARRDPQRVTADRVAHYFHPHRLDLDRGVSRVACVARTFTALARYLDLQLQKARIQASVAVMIARGAASRASVEFPTDKDTDTTDDIKQFDGAMLFEGKAGDELKGFSPPVVSGEFESFIMHCLRSIAVGLNVSYELLARDFSRSNFSNTRQAKLEDRRAFEPRQSGMVRRVCRPVWSWFSDAAALARVDPFWQVEGGIPVRWRTPRWPWVDPLDDVTGASIEVANGFKSPQSVAADRGEEFWEVIDEIAEAIEYAKASGVNLAWFSDQEAVKLKAEAAKGKGDARKSAA